MKKFLLFTLLSFGSLSAMACDQCSCGLLLGIQPRDHANNFGLQWRMRYLQGDLIGTSLVLMPKHGGSHDAEEASEHIVETYSVLELHGQVWLGDRFSLTGSLPVLSNFQSVNGARSADLTAVGDPMLLGRYVVFGSTTGLDTTHLRQRFTVGLGVKMPLGRTDVVQYGELLDHDLQPGSGTWDGLLSAEYMLRGRQWGGSASVMARYNTAGSDGHRMGNSATITAEAFRIIPIKAWRLLPAAGAYLEMARPEQTHGEEKEGTGGNVLFSHLGLRLWWGDLGFAVAWQHALVNDLGNEMTPNRERFTAGITYSFGAE
jgi:hypothetical protein